MMPQVGINTRVCDETSIVNLNLTTQIKNNEIETHKSIFRYVNKLIIGTSNLRNLQREWGECETQSGYANANLI